MSFYSDIGKAKEKTAKSGLATPGEGKKASRSPAAHSRGHVGKQSGPKSPPKNSKGVGKNAHAFVGSESGEGRVNKAPVPGRDKTKTTLAGNPGEDELPDYESEASENHESEGSYDGDCACGYPGCSGCVVGAMKSDLAKASFVRRASKAYDGTRVR